MLTVGIFPNTSKPNVGNIITNIFYYLKKNNVKVLLLKEAAEELGLNCCDNACSLEEMKSEITLAITLGGDGTLLNTARDVAPAGIAICGVNLGRIGFLAQIELVELESKLAKIIQGDYKIEERLMLSAEIFRCAQPVYTALALNDIVVTKGGLSRMINLNLFIDDELTAKYPADGLIIATSTGSTGYSLSSGGPIINPNLKVIAITPICPHTLNSRSLVVSADEEIKVQIEAPHGDIVLTVDGQAMSSILPYDTVCVKNSEFKARFVKFQGRSYYETLRTKLRRSDISGSF